ncbi:MAG: NAD-dependent epimerase/dehydratase family protein [Casimicrobiaceae bacterium]
MTTLIIGAGQIGCHVAQILMAQAHEPVVYDVSPPLEFIRVVLPGARMNLKQGDIRDMASLVDVIREHSVDRIIHTAAILPPKAEDDPLLTTDVNVRGTANVLEAARLTGVERVVFCSTIGVYDLRAISGDRIGEDDPVRCDTVYGASKLYGERLGENYARRRGVGFVALRFAHIFGAAPLPPRPGIASFVGELVSACAQGIHRTVRPRTSAAKEYLYVPDAARAAVLAATAPNLTDCVFNIGTGCVHEPREVAQIARAITPELKIDVEDVAPAGGPGRPFDLTRAHRQLGYAPAYDLEAGMRHFVSHLKRQH